jgi:hypothetical protein
MSKVITTHKLIWGWLRIVLGIAQMSFAAMGFISLLMIGTNWLTWLFVIGAAITTIISWLLYRGKPDPNLTKE